MTNFEKTIIVVDRLLLWGVVLWAIDFINQLIERV